MSAALIWIGFPILMGAVFWYFRSRRGRVVLYATALCLVLAAVAWLVPFGETIRLGPLSIAIDPTLNIAGRRLVLGEAERAFLIMIYLVCSFWFAGSYAAKANTLLIPFGLGVVALLVAALSVEPFLYAALLVEMAVLLSVPILAPPGSRIEQGVLRFLIFQTLAMPFILLAGWALAGVEANPTNTTLLVLSTTFIGLGFAFWLAIFPFYTWVPLLAEQSDSFVSGFVFLVFPTVNLLLALNFLDRFGWLRAAPQVFTVISMVGALMVVTAGVWAAFQRDFARIFGYGVIVETGFSMLAIGLGEQIGKELFSSMFLPRMIGLGLWALSLSIITRAAGSSRFEVLAGAAQRMPFASAGLIVAALTLGGLPLLPVFPIHQTLLEQLANQSIWSALWVLAGSGGMLFSAFRSLAVLTRSGLRPQAYQESRLQVVFIIGGVAGLLLIGTFPQVFLPMLDGLVSGYTLTP